MRRGQRGLPPGGSLARLLAEKRGKRARQLAPRLTLRQILEWADAHHRRTAKWPNQRTGPVWSAPNESWTGIDHALRRGRRGMRGGSSLAFLLSEKRGRRVGALAPRLTVRQVLEWADEHHRRTGEWPIVVSGPVWSAPQESWKGIDHALREGGRGLDGGSSLARLLAKRRGVKGRARSRQRP
jgi:hypothetical protein